jgi:hypothetical protein
MGDSRWRADAAPHAAVRGMPVHLRHRERLARFVADLPHDDDEPPEFAAYSPPCADREIRPCGMQPGTSEALTMPQP